ncbi:hypothetical protein HPULCUR_003540 [Helicostylum pulchrum]|uniref:Uncharacterized protein n=1 Tax=Helicostylum pulchrum TaxID=562976 RepID=A0ABP9XV10_9FUNG
MAINSVPSSSISTFSSWPKDRETALIEATIFHHPFNLKKGTVGENWQKVYDAVNEVDSNTCGKLGKTAIDSKLERMITVDRLKPINDATCGTGGNASETKLENTVFNLRMMMEQDKKAKADAVSSADTEADEALQEKRRRQSVMTRKAEKGKGKKRILGGCHQQASSLAAAANQRTKATESAKFADKCTDDSVVTRV